MWWKRILVSLLIVGAVVAYSQQKSWAVFGVGD